MTLPAVGGEWSVASPEAGKNDVLVLRSGPSTTVILEVSPFKAGCAGGTLAIHVAIAKVTGKAHRVLAPAYLPPEWLGLSVEGHDADRNVAHACVDRPDSSQLDATISTTASLRDPAIAPPLRRLLAAVAQASGAKSGPMPAPQGSATVRVDALGVTITPERPGGLWKTRSETTGGHTMTVVTRANPLDPFLEAAFTRVPGSCSRFAEAFGAKRTRTTAPAYVPAALATTTLTEPQSDKSRKDFFCADVGAGHVLIVETAYQDALDSDDTADLRALLTTVLTAIQGTPVASRGQPSRSSGSSGSGSDRGERQFGLSELSGGLALVMRPAVDRGVASGTAVGPYLDLRISLLDIILEQRSRFRIGDDLAVGLGLGLGLGETDLWGRIRAAIGLQAYYSFSSSFELGARVGVFYEGDSVRDAASKGVYATGKLRVWRLALEGGGGTSDYVVGKLSVLLSDRGTLSPTVGARFEHLAASNGPTSTNTISLELGVPF